MRLATRIRVAGVLFSVVVALAVAAMLTALDGQHDAQREAERKFQIVADTNRAERLLIDAETGQRGFVITGREEFLEPWETGRTAFDRQMKILADQVVDPAQRRLVDQIRVAGRRYLNGYSVPLVALARERRERAARVIAGGEGKRRVDALRRQFDRFLTAQQSIVSATRNRAEQRERRALSAVLAGGCALLLLFVLFVAYLGRSVIRPVEVLTRAAGRLASGELGTRVPSEGSDEVGQLGRAFNHMAGSLEESRDELEAQNLELEAQTAELEDSQSELSGANDELRAQRAELEQAADQLAAEKEAVETSERFARLLAAETELDRLVAIALERFADVARAELATLYGATGPATGEPELRLLATRGVEAADLPQALAPGCGLAGRALAEKRPIIAHHGQTGLTLAAFGEQVAVRHELHLPLRHADRTIAVLTLARVHDSPFVDREIDALHHLGAQMAIALANAAALRAEQRTAAINRAVVDAVRDAIVLVAPDGGIVVANQAARDLAVSGFGLDLTDAPAGVQPQLAEKMTDPEAFARASEEIAGNPPHETFDEFELVEQGRVFERFTAQVRSDSELLGRISVVREVSRERQAERLKNDLMSTVSHELRTPLGSVLGFAELMLIRDVDAPTRQRYLQTIHSEAERLNALIDDFLDLRRIEEGHFELRPEPIDLAELLRERIDLVVVRSPGHGADLRLAADTHLPVVADRARIAQVIDNLLSNAVKYSPDGGDITIEAHQAVGMVRVCVIDRGLGIPADQQSQLFDKFFRVDREASRHIGGTGLGLTLCREIVEAHGGSIDFESHEGAGSRFCFEIPRSGPATTNPE